VIDTHAWQTVPIEWRPKASVGRPLSWRANSSLLRVTGNNAKAARQLMSAAFTCASFSANAGKAWAQRTWVGRAAIKAASRKAGSRDSKASK
jgi:hypothetical protein